MADKDRPSDGNQLESLSEYTDSILPKSSIRYDELFSNLSKKSASSVSSIDNIEYTDYDYDYEDIVNTLVKSRLEKKREILENEKRIQSELKQEADQLDRVAEASFKEEAVPEEVKKSVPEVTGPKDEPDLPAPPEKSHTKPVVVPAEPVEEELEDLEDLEEAGSVDEIEDLEEAGSVDEIEELEEDIEDLSYLAEKINRETEAVEYPGAFDITGIDPSLKNRKVEQTVEKMPDTDMDEEVFGVRKAEVYYQIDKQIYTKRATATLGLSSIANLKSGLMLPFIVIVSCIAFIALITPSIMFIVNRASATPLEENVINDNSILSKIAKEKEEEARRAQEQLENEKRLLEEQKSRMEETINEELAKRQADIENDFKKRMEELKKQGLSQAELDKLQKQLEAERLKARQTAESEAEKRRTEQEKLIAEKDQELARKSDEIQKALESREYELSQITDSFRVEIEQKEKEREEIAARLKQIREYNQDVKDFNLRVYQLINSGIEEFQTGNREGGVSRFLDAARYYDSRNSFVLSDEELTNKMITDKFFIQSINDMVAESKNASLYNEEMVKTLNKFKKINEFYNSGEVLYGQQKYIGAAGEYQKALKEFEIIGLSFEKVRQMERLVQNTQAGGYYNQALEQMKEGRYNQAIDQLSKIIIQTPQSDYVDESLKNITELSGLVSSGTEKSNADVDAAPLFKDAESLEKRNLYAQALEKYKEVIVKYPASSYTGSSLNRSLALKEILDEKKVTDFKESLTRKFNENYSKFVAEYEKGNFKTARGYYFSALANTFSIYAENSVEEFVKAENEYIDSLIASASLETGEDVQERIDQIKKELEDGFNTQLKQKEEDIAGLEASLKDYQDRLTRGDTEAKDELERIRQEYEAKLSEKSGEIDGLNSAIADLKSQLESAAGDGVASAEFEKLKKSYEEKVQEVAGLNEKISGLQAQIESIEPDSAAGAEFEKLKKSYEEKVEEVAGLNEKISGLQAQIESIDPNTVAGEEYEKLKKSYEDKLKEVTALNKKITELQAKLDSIDPTAVTREEVDKLKTEYEKKLEEVEEIKAEALLQKEKYIISLKSQLLESYKDIQKLKDELEYPTVSDDKYKEMENKLSTLQKQYAALEKSAMKNKYSQDKVREDILEEVQSEYNEKLNLEKKRLREEFARELEKIRSSSSVDKTLSTTETVKKTAQKNKLVARIIELIDKSATFQFLSTSMISEVSVNDEVTIIRYVEGKEVVVGTMKVTYTSSNSLFGRGRVVTTSGGYVPKINDILKN